MFPGRSFGCHVKFGLGQRFIARVADLMYFDDFL